MELTERQKLLLTEATFDRLERIQTEIEKHLAGDRNALTDIAQTVLNGVATSLEIQLGGKFKVGDQVLLNQVLPVATVVGYSAGTYTLEGPYGQTCRVTDESRLSAFTPAPPLGD